MVKVTIRRYGLTIIRSGDFYYIHYGGFKMSNKENVIPEVRQIRSALGKMKEDDEFMLTIPIISDSGDDDDRTEEKEKTDRLLKANKRKETQHGREEL